MPAGQFVTIIGSNGSGKSTMLNAIAGTFPLTGGSVVIDGRDVSRLREHVRSRIDGARLPGPARRHGAVD